MSYERRVTFNAIFGVRKNFFERALFNLLKYGHAMLTLTECLLNYCKLDQPLVLKHMTHSI